MPNFERSVAARRTWADEWIEFWGAVYVAHPVIAARGVLFETFLFAPREVIASLYLIEDVLASTRGMEIALLAVEHLERTGARCSNGAWVEKLRHHRHPPGVARREPAREGTRAG